MKVELEFELVKDVLKIEDLIAGRVFSMDCVDKSKDVKARVIEPVKVQNQCDGCAIGAPVNQWGNHMYPDGTRMGCTKAVYEVQKQPLKWPDLIELPVIVLPEGETA